MGEHDSIDINMTIDSILAQYPLAAEVFTALGMACVGCVFSRFHTLVDAAVIYQLNHEQILNLLYDRLGSSHPSQSAGEPPVAAI